MSEEKQQEEQNVYSFVDAKGRVWTPRVDTRVLRDYELRSGMGVFEAIFKALTEVKKGKNKKSKIANEAVIFSMAQALFGSIGDLMFLLYESCRPDGNIQESPVAHFDNSNGIHEGEGAEVTFEDFCSSITKVEVDAALKVALVLIVEYLPRSEEGGDAEGGPFGFGLSAGEMFMNLQR